MARRARAGWRLVQWGNEAAAVERLRAAATITMATRRGTLAARALDAERHVLRALGVHIPPPRARYWVAEMMELGALPLPPYMGPQAAAYIWIHQDKTRRDAENPNTVLRHWRVSACGHPEVVSALRPYYAAAANDRSLLFPTATPERVLRWLRGARKVDPAEVPRLTAHGIRTGVDTEMMELGAPVDWINTMGHWARAKVDGRTSATDHSSIDIGKMMLLTAQLGRLRLHHPVPGFHTSASAPPPIDWDAAWHDYRRTLPDEPPKVRGAAAALCVDDEEGEGEA